MHASLPRTRRLTAPSGYTIIEILVAATISLIMMLVVVNIMGTAGTSISTSRAALEMSDRLRETQARLAQDLRGLTVTMSPPRDPAANEGYFEYIEGPVGVVMFDPANPRQVPNVASPPNPPPDPYGDTLLDTNNTAQEPNFPAVAVSDTGEFDTTVGDYDDVLMFTTRSEKSPFVGRFNNSATIQSSDAEVIWFVRGRTLYRRVLLVAPSATLVAPEGFYAYNDVSVHNVGGVLVGNTLSDLTKRENRFAHQGAFPFDIRAWGQLRLPILAECSYHDSTTPANSWIAGATGPLTVPGFTPPLPSPPARSQIDSLDFWTPTHPWTSLLNTPPPAWSGVNLREGRLNAYPGARIGEDVILTNVIGFDVKAWDPGVPVLQYSGGPAMVPGDPGYSRALKIWLNPPATPPPAPPNVIGYGAYVDLNYAQGVPTVSSFSGPGSAKAVAAAFATRPLNQGLGWTYDTWSTHYENDAVDQDDSGTADEGTNGFDDDGNGVVDDAGEFDTSAPYPVPLRGIQVKIRVFEPDSRQIREVTIVQRFD